MKNPLSLKLNKPLGKIFSALEPLQRKIILRLALLVVVPLVTVVLIFAQTVAWKTNVVNTSGVMFSADDWNFSATVALTGQDTSVSPGESGVIDMQLKNDSADLAAASVRVSKEQIIEQMRSRLYFYIDTPTVRNSETVSRVYVNGRNSYTYTIFPHNELLLDSSSKMAPLKWEWTYDNLGYYVYGKRAETGHIIVEEYLSPIEYDYDFMRTTFDANGKLETVDGQKSVSQFLTEFSEHDGYEGQIDALSVNSEGYYTVTFNEATGYGVFAYLCTLDEINQGSVNDTQLGNSVANLGLATVNITGQNCNTDGTLISSAEGLKQSLSSPGLNILKLDGDITLSEPLSVNDASQVVIDLAGHKITSEADSIFDVKNGASLMLSNGEIAANGKAAVTSVGASVTLENVTVSDVERGIAINDHQSNGLDSVVHIKDCNINASEEGLMIYGNGLASEKKSSIFIENSNIIGENYAGLVCNGAQYGTDITIKNSTLKGKYTGAYFPQRDSTVNIENSVLEGYTGLAVKGGYVNVVDSTITGTGAYQPLPSDASGLSNSGWWDTGDGVYLESNYSLWETKVTISGDKTVVTGSQDGTLAVRQFPFDAANAKITVLGGTFNTDVSDYLSQGSTQSLVDGKYVVSPPPTTP